MADSESVENLEARLDEFAAQCGESRRELERRGLELAAAIAKLREAHRDGIYDSLTRHSRADAALHNFVLKNPSLFDKVKSRKGDFGSYGWRRQPESFDAPSKAEAGPAVAVLEEEGFSAAVKVEKVLAKSGLAGVPDEVLAQAGIVRNAALDMPFVKYKNAKLDAWVESLLGAGE